MASPLENPNTRTVPEDGMDALTELSLKAGKAVQEYLGTTGGIFVPPIKMASVLADALGCAKDSQEALAAANEISAMALANKGKAPIDSKKWQQVIGKYFGIAGPWKSPVLMSADTCKKGDMVKWKGPEGGMQGKIVSVHTSGKPDGLQKGVEHDEPSEDEPVAKVQIHKKNDDGDQEATDDHHGVALKNLKPVKPAPKKTEEDDEEDEDEDKPAPKKGKANFAKPKGKAEDDEDDEDDDDEEDDEDEDEDDDDDDDEDEDDDDEDDDEKFSLNSQILNQASATFAKLSKEDRDKMDVREFGDPDNRLFPITDQNDVDSAMHLIGKASDPEKVKHNIKTICKRKKLQCPAAWKTGKDKATMSIEFSVSEDAPVEDGDHVLRDAPLVFRCGDYPDKDFTLSPEEAMAAVRDFQPVEIDLEHKPTVFNGKLGTLAGLKLNPDSWTMSGKTRIPKWLDAILPKDERKLSLAFHRKNKNVIGCSLVRNPRVTDAAMMAAFSAAFPLPADPSIVTVPAPASVPAKQDGTAIPGLTDKKIKEMQIAAATFARNEVVANRAAPVEQPVLAQQHFNAQMDDLVTGTLVEFSGGERITRTEQLRRAKLLTPEHNLTKETVPVQANNATALFNQDKTPQNGKPETVTEERKKELLAKSALGRNVLAIKK